MEITLDVVIFLSVNNTWVQPEKATVFNTPEQKYWQSNLRNIRHHIDNPHRKRSKICTIFCYRGKSAYYIYFEVLSVISFHFFKCSIGYKYTDSNSSRKSPAVPLHAQFVRRSVPLWRWSSDGVYINNEEDDFSPSISSIASLQLP